MRSLVRLRAAGTTARVFGVRLLVILAVLVPAVPGGAQTAGSYPDKPVRIIVPFAPAGPTDVVARLIASKLSERLGKQFYIENVAGAGGNLGMGQAARATPDGYTVLFVSSSYVVNPSLYAKIPYDPGKDFEPVTVAGDAPNILLVHPSVPAKTVKELVDLIKANPGKYSFASAGTGTTPHLSGELFRLSLGLDLVHVPFGGAGPALQSTVAGHTLIAFTGVPGAAAQVQAGALRALGVTSPQRNSALPDVPTMAQAGVAGPEAETLLCVLVPAGTPKPIIALLHREIVAIVALPDVRQKFAAFGFDALAGAPDQTRP